LYTIKPPSLASQVELPDPYSSELAKLTALEKLILPLLVNLMKNPEKDTIKWPGRAPIIEKQIEKILKLTRG
jgi:hypothetical protein